MTFFVYEIRCKASNEVYVGLTESPKQRWAQHKANRNIGNGALYAAMRKHGIDAFSFEVVLTFEDRGQAQDAEFSRMVVLRKAGHSLFNTELERYPRRAALVSKTTLGAVGGFKSSQYPNGYAANQVRSWIGRHGFSKSEALMVLNRLAQFSGVSRQEFMTRVADHYLVELGIEKGTLTVPVRVKLAMDALAAVKA